MEASRAQIEALFASVCNWGRWSEQDELGTLNLITPDRRLTALAEVDEGVAIGCGRTLGARETTDTSAAQLFVIDGGDIAPPEGFGRARDWLSVGAHGLGQTHLDALCHVFYNGRMYNGRPASDVRSSGAVTNAVTAVGDGVVGRGVLLDVPLWRGVDYIEPSEAVRIQDLDGAERAQDVAVGEGDVLLVRICRRARERAGHHGPEMAGLHPECLTWLHERGVALLGSDGTNDVLPAPYAVRSPVHAGALVFMGLHLLDNAELEELSAACQSRRRWSFLFTLAPLRLSGGTGSVVNPVVLI